MSQHLSKLVPFLLLALSLFPADSSCSTALLDPTTSSWGGGYTLVGTESDSVQVLSGLEYLGGLYSFFSCYSQPLLPASESDFRGIYVIDGIQTSICRQVNPYTSDCSCPAGSNQAHFQVYDISNWNVQVYFCESPSASEGAVFRGAVLDLGYCNGTYKFGGIVPC